MTVVSSGCTRTASYPPDYGCMGLVALIGCVLVRVNTSGHVSGIYLLFCNFFLTFFFVKSR